MIMNIFTDNLYRKMGIEIIYNKVNACMSEEDKQMSDLFNLIRIAKERNQKGILTDLANPQRVLEIAKHYDWEIVELDSKDHNMLLKAGYSSQQIEAEFVKIKF